MHVYIELATTRWIRAHVLERKKIRVCRQELQVVVDDREVYKDYWRSLFGETEMRSCFVADKGR